MHLSLRRFVLAAFVLAGAFAACSVAHVDEAQVRTAGADHLDCEEQLLKLENLEGPGNGIARYRIQGCGRTTTLDCMEEKSQVACRHVSWSHGESGDADGEVAGAVVGAAAGCACGSLFGRSKDSNDETPSSSPSPMSTTPQRTRR
jgi:hypothetical protein